MQVMITPEQYAWLERLAEAADVNLATVVRHLCAVRLYPADDPTGYVELIERLREDYEHDLELAITEHEAREEYVDFTVSP